LSQTDSSSASGWLHKTNFAESDDEIAQMATARQIAYLMLENQSCLYSQWFPGDENIVSDCLSRDFHLPDKTLTIFIKSSTPSQVPFGLTINPLPKEIVSWLTNLLQNLPEKTQWSSQPTRSKLSLGLGIPSTFTPSEFQTFISQNSPNPNDIQSWEHLDTQYDRVDSILNETNLVKRSQLEPPWIMWHRPTDWPTTLTQDSTSTVNLLSFYKNRLKDTEIATQPSHNKWPSPHQSYENSTALPYPH